MRTISRSAVFFLILCLLCGSGDARAEAPKAASKGPHVVLLVIDTLRADHLPFYGYKKNTAPFLATLAEHGTVFETAYATSSWTAPATASILTSLHPLQHGVLQGRNASKKLMRKDPEAKLNKLPESAVTIAELLKTAGYATFAVADNGNIRADAGFAQGFDKFATYESAGGKTVNQTVRSWSDEIKAAQKYFLYVQYMDPHFHYIAQKPWFDGQDKKGIPRQIAAYDSEIALTDACIKELAEHFNWRENTLIVITSDHGEEFMDHGRHGHGKTLYREVVQIPLVLYFPRAGLQHTRVAESVSALDILPTVAGLLELPAPDQAAGENLAPYLRGRDKLPAERVHYAHLWKKRVGGKEVYMRSVTIGNERFMTWNFPDQVRAYFDIGSDPRERKNLINEKPERVAFLDSKFDEFEKTIQRLPYEWAEIDRNEPIGEDE